jgi:hypothetical protein
VDVLFPKNTGFGTQVVNCDEKYIHAFFIRGMKGTVINYQRNESKAGKNQKAHHHKVLKYYCSDNSTDSA